MGPESIDSVPTHFCRHITLPGHQLLETSHIINMLEPVNMFLIACFLMDEPDINKLLVLKNKLLRRLQKQTLLTPVCQLESSFNTLPIPFGL